MAMAVVREAAAMVVVSLVTGMMGRRRRVSLRGHQLLLLWLHLVVRSKGKGDDDSGQDTVLYCI